MIFYVLTYLFLGGGIFAYKNMFSRETEKQGLLDWQEEHIHAHVMHY